MASKPPFAGDPGTRWTNDTGKVLWQFHATWQNTCGVCAQYDTLIGQHWPIPLHPSCRCFQIPIMPDAESEPFVDFRGRIERLPDRERAKVIGKSALDLVESGTAKWRDVVTPERVRTLEEVVARKRLTLGVMERSDVGKGPASRAYYSRKTRAEQRAESRRKDELVRDWLGRAGLEPIPGQEDRELTGPQIARLYGIDPDAA